MEGEIKRRDADTEVTKEDVKILIEDMFKLTVKPGVQIIDAIPQEFLLTIIDLKTDRVLGHN